MDKRTFVKSLALLSLGAGPISSRLQQLIAAPLPAGDDDFWTALRDGYTLNPDWINLENGYYCIQPRATLEKFLTHVRDVNREGAHYMRTVQFENKQRVAKKLADVAGCSPQELVITRNTTESLDLVIAGFDWQRGDEAVMAEQDYGAMLDMFKQVARRHGVVNKVVSLPNHPQSDEEVVELYARALTSKTKLLMISHMVNITGQILPVRKICDMAHSRGVQVMVDGAHAFAHLVYRIPDLHCDYYGASLHKWLSTPLGAGILYVKKENISRVWPLLADGDRAPDDIARLNHIGTHPVHTDLTIEDALDMYQQIGPARKEARLRFLQTYWTSQVRDIPRVVVNTPKDPARACAIANVGIQDMKPQALADVLLSKYKIYTVAIDGANVHGCRITPNVFTTTGELDVLVKALRELAS